jgi:putative endonuclease
MSNYAKTVLYVGVTNNIQRRVQEHKQGINDGFTKKYKVDMLMYCETVSDIETALVREKQLKHWNRSKKESLINSLNPQWKDLSKEDSFALF